MYVVRHTKVALAVHLIMPTAFFAYLVLAPWVVPVYGVETAHYQNFSNIYPVGYPLFLNLIAKLSGQLDNAAYVQSLFFALGVFYLSLCIGRTTGSNLLGILVACAVLFNPFMPLLLMTLLPTALFVTFSLLMCGFFLSAMTHAHVFNKMVIGACIGAVAMLQSSGWAYLFLIPVAAVYISHKSHGSTFRTMIISALVFLCLMIFEFSAYSSIHDKPVRYPAAPYLFAKTVLMDSEQSSPYVKNDPRTKIWIMIEENLASQRSAIQSMASYQDRMVQLRTQEDFVRQYFAKDELQEASEILGKPVDKVMVDMAISRIVQDPVAFLKISLDHYRALWDEHRQLMYPQLWISLFLSVVGLWYWIIGARVGSLVGLSFLSALMLQAQTIWVAVSGQGAASLLIALSPLMLISLLCMLLAFYVTYIRPTHTDL